MPTFTCSLRHVASTLFAGTLALACDLSILEDTTPDIAEEVALECGGIIGAACPEGLECVDDPADDCDPDKGGADCIGVCVEPDAEAGCDPEDDTCPTGQACVDDPADDCDPAVDVACAGVCVDVPQPLACAGAQGLECPQGLVCVDAPDDGCDLADDPSCAGTCEPWQIVPSAILELTLPPSTHPACAHGPCELELGLASTVDDLKIPPAAGPEGCDDPDRTYVSHDLEVCALVKFLCAPGLQHFADDCGCGCEPEDGVD